MTFGKLVAPSMKEMFVERLAGMILSGELKLGDRLPSEREIAKDMGMGKTVVHDGITELARLGFVAVMLFEKGLSRLAFCRSGLRLRSRKAPLQR